MRTIIFITIALGMNGILLAQKSISGVVSDQTGPLPGVSVLIKGTNAGTQTDFDGKYTLMAKEGDLLIFTFIGKKTKKVSVRKPNVYNVFMEDNNAVLDEVVITAMGTKREKKFLRFFINKKHNQGYTDSSTNNESYQGITENTFKNPQNNPLSTFSIDVDKASYSTIRRMINNGQKIPKDAVRIEEMINYFTYDYPQPVDEHPFAIQTELGRCPWNEQHQLLKIGLQGEKIPTDNLPASNLVFLIDVSGSMNSANKLPLLKVSFKLLVNQLREQDKVAIVVYAGAAGVVLEPTSGSNKQKILEALNQLEAGGSTAGGEGISLAYKLASKHFNKKGNNRIILATDGDFNVGASSDKAMEQLIEEKRKTGIYLTVLGFGMGNYKDSKLEILADKGNGNHAYIDTMQEAQRVLGQEFGGTLFTIAKDVKIQVEFNPNKVQGYRLLGYENRLLNDEDFTDDTIDAGEIGSGHTVTALYELIPVGVKSKFTKNLPTLKYSNVQSAKEFNDELATIKFRYKKPHKNNSIEIIDVVPDTMKDLSQVSKDYQFISSVAMFGMLLRNSKFKGKASYDKILDFARKGKAADSEGYRAEFIRLVKTVQ